MRQEKEENISSPNNFNKVEKEQTTPNFRGVRNQSPQHVPLQAEDQWCHPLPLGNTIVESRSIRGTNTISAMF